jgi:hypothetical protein
VLEIIPAAKSRRWYNERVTALYEKLSSFIIDSSSWTFDDAALALFEYQYANNAPYKRLCDGVGRTPANTDTWTAIPAAPAQAFRIYDLTCVPTELCRAVFHSSGTTAAQSSRHWMSKDALELYELSLRTHYHSVFTFDYPIWAVMPSPSEAPHSSLSHMLGALSAQKFSGDDLNSIQHAISLNSTDGPPIALFGTAFGLVELLTLGANVPYVGSRVIETGGFKGRTKELSRTEFYALLREGFAIDDASCYSEYGMCEMASQFYSQGEHGMLKGPHWCRTQVIDPATGEEALAGHEGLLRHFDLANLNSVCALQTQDRGFADRYGSFRILGRATDAELRGCSLTAEELWSR